MMSDREYRDFEGYCHNCTDWQLINVIEKEKEFADTDLFRKQCLRIAQTVARARGILEY